MSEWRETRLGDLVTMTSGKPIKPRTEGPFQAFGSNGVIGGSPEARHSRGLIVGRVGAYCGSVAMSDRPFWASDNTIVLEPRDASDLNYLYYLLLGADLNRHAGGAAQPLVTQSTLKALPFLVPDRPTRYRIGQILTLMDDLIEANLRRIELLERMAQAIYREWFVHFRYPGHEDDERVDSSLGPIPVNWSAVRTAQLIESSVLEIGDGYRAKNSEFSDEGVPFVRVSNVQNGTLQLAGSDLLSFDYVARVAGKASRPGDCVVATKGTVGRVAFVGEATPTVIYSPQVSYWRSLDSSTLSPAYLRRWIQSDHFRLQCARVKGATDMADYVNLKDQRRMWMLLPERRVQTEFAAKVGPMHQLADSLSGGASVLSDLRDRLLPKLVTGQIDISTFDLDALLEEPAA